jgi:hypothetical protein
MGSAVMVPRINIHEDPFQLLAVQPATASPHITVPLRGVTHIQLLTSPRDSAGLLKAFCLPMFRIVVFYMVCIATSIEQAGNSKK